jgi:hypothetical protein
MISFFHAVVRFFWRSDNGWGAGWKWTGRWATNSYVRPPIARGLATPCWKAQTTQGLRCSLRADCAKRGRFSTQRAVRGAVCDRSPREVCAQTTRSLRADNARSQCVVCALTTCSNSKISKKKKKKGTLHNVCMYYSIDGIFFHYPASLYQGHVRIWTRDSCMEVQCLTNYTMEDTWI